MSAGGECGYPSTTSSTDFVPKLKVAVATTKERVETRSIRVSFSFSLRFLISLSLPNICFWTSSFSLFRVVCSCSSTRITVTQSPVRVPKSEKPMRNDGTATILLYSFTGSTQYAYIYMCTRIKHELKLIIFVFRLLSESCDL